MPIETRQQERERIAAETAAREQIESPESITDRFRRSVSQLFGQTSPQIPIGETEHFETPEMNPIPMNNAPTIKAPTFDGAGDVEAFAWQFRNLKNHYQWDDATAINQLAFALTGNALERYFHRWGDTQPITFDAAIMGLKEIFGVTKRPTGDYEGIFTLRQKANESIDDFNDRFQSECLQIQGGVDDAVKKSSFLRGLRAEISRSVYDADVSTFAAVIKTAKKSERTLSALKARESEQEAEKPKPKTITYPTTVSPNYQGRTPWQNPNPCPPMGGAPRPGWNNPRPMGYIAQIPVQPRVLGPMQPNRNMGGAPPGNRDTVMEDLRRRLEAVTINST